MRGAKGASHSYIKQPGSLAMILTSPLSGSGLLMAAASATAGCSKSALSTSNGPMRYLRQGSNHNLDKMYKLAV